MDSPSGFWLVLERIALIMGVVSGIVGGIWVIIRRWKKLPIWPFKKSPPPFDPDGLRGLPSELPPELRPTSPEKFRQDMEL